MWNICKQEKHPTNILIDHSFQRLENSIYNTKMPYKQVIQNIQISKLIDAPIVPENFKFFSIPLANFNQKEFFEFVKFQEQKFSYLKAWQLLRKRVEKQFKGYPKLNKFRTRKMNRKEIVALFQNSQKFAEIPKLQESRMMEFSAPSSQFLSLLLREIFRYNKFLNAQEN